MTYAVDDEAGCATDDCNDRSCPNCPRIEQEILAVAQPMGQLEHTKVHSTEGGALYVKRVPREEGQAATIEVRP